MNARLVATHSLCQVFLLALFPIGMIEIPLAAATNKALLPLLRHTKYDNL